MGGLLALVICAAVIFVAVNKYRVHRYRNDYGKWLAFVREKRMPFERQSYYIKKWDLPYEPSFPDKIEQSLSAPPDSFSIPVAAKEVPIQSSAPGSYTDIDDFENSRTTYWQGKTKPVEFTYKSFDGQKARRTVTVTELFFSSKGKPYLRGLCHDRNEVRSFKVNNISTMIKVGSNRYYFLDFCEQVLGLDLSRLPSDLPY